MTQEELAVSLGVLRSTYANWEQGVAEPPPPVMAKLHVMGFGADVGPPTIPASQLYIPIPYIGMVSANMKVNWTDPFESESMEFVPPEMGDVRGRFSCRVESDSMYDFLYPNDLVVFQKDPTPKIGKVILFRAFDHRITIKQLKHDGRDYVLQPINLKYPVEVAEGDCVGYLVGIVRESGSRKLTIYDAHGIAV